MLTTPNSNPINQEIQKKEKKKLPAAQLGFATRSNVAALTETFAIDARAKARAGGHAANQTRRRTL
jgi:hypothetical protein